MFKVTLGSGEPSSLPQPTYADLISFEKHFNVPAPMIEEEPRAEWVAYLAWRGLKRQGQPVGEFDAFCETITEITLEADSPKGSETSPATTDSPPSTG